MSLSKFQKLVIDSKAWHATVHGITVRHNWATELNWWGIVFDYMKLCALEILFHLFLWLAVSKLVFISCLIDVSGMYYFLSEYWPPHNFPVIQFSSVAQSCPTLYDPMNCSTPGLPVHHQLLEFTQTHIHQVSGAIQPPHPRSSPSPPAPNPSEHQSLFQWVNSLHQVAKVLEFQL